MHKANLVEIFFRVKSSHLAGTMTNVDVSIFFGDESDDGSRL